VVGDLVAVVAGYLEALGGGEVEGAKALAGMGPTY